MTRPLMRTGLAFSSTGSGRVASAKPTPPSISGRRRSRRAPSCVAGHEPSKWNEFRRRYGAELAGKAALLDELRAMARCQPITLLYAAHDMLHNEAVVLRDLVTS